MLDLFAEFNRVISSFHSGQLRYAVVGALAVAIHGGVRATEDMDFLVDEDESEKVRVLLEELKYFPGKPWKFSNTQLTLWRFTRPTGEGEEYFLIDILLAGTPEFKSIITRAHEERWADRTIRVARREDLIWMKTLRGSFSDRADIEFLRQDEKQITDE